MEGILILTATDVDKTSPSTLGAYELLLLGDDPNAYLDLELIIEKAKSRGAIGIHPGWGFISENESIYDIFFETFLLLPGLRQYARPAQLFVERIRLILINLLM